MNDENVPPVEPLPMPVLRRQVAQEYHVHFSDHSVFVPNPNGMFGYTDLDWENTQSNGGWYEEDEYSSDGYEFEMMPSSGSESDTDEETDIDEFDSTDMAVFDSTPPQ